MLPFFAKTARFFSGKKRKATRCPRACSYTPGSYAAVMSSQGSSTAVAQGFTMATAVLGVGGSVYTSSLLPAVYGLLYTACFVAALRGLPSPLQVVVVLAMIGLSFALHLVFLPAGPFGWHA